MQEWRQKEDGKTDIILSKEKDIIELEEELKLQCHI